MQIGGIAGNSSSEHLVVSKTWMKKNEVGGTIGIFQAFNTEKLSFKEGIIDTMYTKQSVECLHIVVHAKQ